MQRNTIITGAVALIVGLGVGYFGSTAFAAKAPARNAAFARGGFTASSTAAFGRNGAMGGLLSGTVASQDSGSITLNTNDGSSHVVLVTPDTVVEKSVQGSLADVAEGDSVIVTGTTNTDGSVSATSIQIRPAGVPTGAPMIPAVSGN